MIEKISIQNIQSHKNTVLEFSPGINAIVGSSNNGKSAILRALYWVRYNRPLGTDNLLSHWAVDKKGNQIAPMQVIVKNENGTVARRRTKDENQYIVNEQELNVVKTDVPEQVEQFLKLSDTNIQRQQDAPFLLSLTSGQVAQYFNKTVRLDIIDKVLSNAESKRRKTMQEINQNNELCEQYKQRKEKYNWLDDVEKIIAKYENISAKNNKQEEKYNLLKQQFDSYQKFSSLKDKVNFVFNAENEISKIEKLDNACCEFENKINALKSSLKNENNCQNRIYSSFSKQKVLIKEIESVDVEAIQRKINYLEETISNYEKLEQKIKNSNLEIVSLKKQLPDICPICGSKMKDGKCVEE